jgi:hypothetical protein
MNHLKHESSNVVIEDFPFCSQQGSIEKQTIVADRILQDRPCLLRIPTAIGCLAFLRGCLLQPPRDSGVAWPDIREQDIILIQAFLLFA